MSRLIKRILAGYSLTTLLTLSGCAINQTSEEYLEVHINSYQNNFEEYIEEHIDLVEELDALDNYAIYNETYIIVTNVSGTLEPRELRVGEEFLGFILESVEPEITFIGNMVLSGNLHTWSDSPTHLFGIIGYSFNIDESHLDDFPYVFVGWRNQTPISPSNFSLEIWNIDKLHELLRLSEDEVNSINNLEILGLGANNITIEISGFFVHSHWITDYAWISEIISTGDGISLLTAEQWNEFVLRGSVWPEEDCEDEQKDYNNDCN